MDPENNDINMKNEKGGLFLCESCGLREPYHYYGQKPKFQKGVTFLEGSYLMKDPFQEPGKQSFLFLGAECLACKRTVCQSEECSIFYTKRFCIDCAKSSIDEMPKEMKKKIQNINK